MKHRLPPALLIALSALLWSTSALAAPTVKPLANEPIIRTLEAGESTTSIEKLEPVAPDVETAQAANREPTPAVAKVVSPQLQSPPAITKRKVALYGIVVASLLGAMCLAIFLILRRGDDRRRRQIVLPPTPLATPPLPGEPGAADAPLTLSGEPAWTRQPPSAPRSTFLS